MKRNEAVLSIIRELPCSVCQAPPPSEPHHWKTRGAGGQDTLENLVSLCQKHHKEFHDRGRVTWYLNHGAKMNGFRLVYGLPIITLEIK